MFVLWATKDNETGAIRGFLREENIRFMEEDVATMNPAAVRNYSTLYGTRPQVFHKGKRVGGLAEVKAYIEAGNAVARQTVRNAAHEGEIVDDPVIPESSPLLGINWEDYYASRALRDGVTRQEAKVATYKELYSFSEEIKEEEMDFPREVIHVQRLGPRSKMPVRGSEHAIGHDLFCDLGGLSEEVTLYPGDRKVFQTGIAVAIPSGHYLRIAPRSGLAAKAGIQVLAGVVDYDYRGEISVVLLNTGRDPVAFKHGDRIAQMILERASLATVEEVAKLSTTARGTNGFGSTGTA